MNNLIEEFTLQITGEEHRVLAEWNGLRRSRSAAGKLDADLLRVRTIDALVDLLRRNQLHRAEELELLGEHLFVTLFGTAQDDGSPGRLLRQALQGEIETDDVDEMGETKNRMLRVSIEFDAKNDRFAAWPWEYLYVPEERENPNSGFLGERRDLVLMRRLRLSAADSPIVVRPPLRVLRAVLSPAGLAPIEDPRILETLIELRNTDRADRIELRVLSQQHAPDGTKHSDPDGDPRTTYRRFIYALDEFNPHVVHIIGHGQYDYQGDEGPCGQLAFPRLDSTPGWITDRVLANELRDRNLRLVFLQACETADASSHPFHAISGMAQALAQRNIPAVIGMHFQVNSAMASNFARAFYKPLMERKHIEVAMQAGRRALHLGGVSEETERRGFGMPVLYLRKSSPLLLARATQATSVGGSGLVAQRPGGAGPGFAAPRTGGPADERFESLGAEERMSSERSSA